MRIDRNTFEVKKIGDGAAANEPGFPQKPDFSDSVLHSDSLRNIVMRIYCKNEYL